jgi:hypothetical protein
VPLAPVLLKPYVRPYGAALALLCAVFAGASQVQHGSHETVSVQSFSSREYGGTEILDPQQGPFARSEGRSSHGLRGKGSPQGKHHAFTATDPARLTSAACARRQHAFVRPEPGGYLQLRTQNPRAPPLPADPA